MSLTRIFTVVYSGLACVKQVYIFEIIVQELRIKSIKNTKFGIRTKIIGGTKPGIIHTSTPFALDNYLPNIKIYDRIKTS